MGALEAPDPRALDRVDLAVPIELVANEVQEDDDAWAQGCRDHGECQLIDLEHRRSWRAACRPGCEFGGHDRSRPADALTPRRVHRSWVPHRTGVRRGAERHLNGAMSIAGRSRAPSRARTAQPSGGRAPLADPKRPDEIE